MPEVSRRTALKAGLACVACAAVPRLARGMLLPTETLGRFVIRISQTENAELLNVNGSKVFAVPGLSWPDPQSEIVVTRRAGNTFSALSAICTHEGTQVQPYNPTLGTILCTGHGSQFRLDGSVAQGPAVRALPRFTATFDAPSNSVFVELPDFVGAEANTGAPSLQLDPVTPNPSASEARLRYTLPTEGSVRVSMYDAQRRLVAVVVDDVQAAGPHDAIWNTAAVAAGVYLVRLEAAGEVRTRAVTVTR